LGTAFSIAASGFAFAADMAVKAPPPAPAPVTNWTGWYAGINFGGGWGTSNNATTTLTPLVDELAQFFPGTTPSGSLAGANAGVAALNQSGPIGGVQIGYNWQFSPLIVVGFEADIQGAAITSDRAGNTGSSTESFAGTSTFTKTVTTTTSAEALAVSFTNAAISASGFNSVTADVNWLGTVRARLGYLVTPNLLLYATGGLAYGGVSASTSLTTNFNTITADSFALAFAQAFGPSPVVAVSAIAGTTPTATASAGTAAITPPVTCTAQSGLVAVCAFNAFNSGQSVFGQAQQVPRPLSRAITTTSQSFADVSSTRVGGTIGGGFEWMMAPNWSVKAEALYYDLGSVTVRTTSTSSINPLSFVSGAAGTFAGSATVSNATSTRVNFQGVIIRLGLNYHFKFL